MSNQTRESNNASRPAMGFGRGPGGPMRGRGEKARNFKGTASRFLKETGHYKWSLLAVIIFAALSCLFSIAAPTIMGYAINIVEDGALNIVNNTGGMDYNKLLNMLFILLGLRLAAALSGYVQSFIVSGVSTGISYEFRQKISSKINRLPLSYFDKVSYGDVLSRVTNDVDTINQSLNQSLSQIISSVINIVGIFIIMLTISPVMTLIAVGVMLISPLCVAQVVKRSQKFFKRQQEYLGKVNGQVEEAFSGHMVIKAFGAEEDILAAYNENNDELYNSAWKSNFLSGLMQPLMGLIGNFAYVFVCLVGGFMVLRGSIRIGDISSFILYMRNFTMPISQVAQISNVLQSTAAAAERVFDFLNEPEEEDDSKKPNLSENIEGAVRFENVNFGYNEQNTVINNFSVEIKPGQKVAIVGPTGAGKTTIVKLLMRFYELNSGAIYIDGENIGEVNRNSLRNAFGMVLQDTWLFSGSVKENIRFAEKNVSDEEIISAAKAANIHRYIKTLPGGYDYIIDEESDNISQGQKQLLTIARAFLSKPKILILDEATSSVDTRTELVIQKAMAKLMEGKTSFVIAHRLSTIRDADLILVMKDGDIVEQGDHKDLLAKNGFYAELYNSQFENVS
ncbi:ABC transporter ATP-binding protein/permease [Tyzzerella sp. OttesenSCG-928-J15]|nr:ABC transporter ATP-binding protein/permease [Tyzzerella sp. OttesenSCG-928-J15]